MVMENDLYDADHERFRFARETTFGRRHLTYWSKSTVSLWMVGIEILY
jgi:mlo protein